MSPTNRAYYTWEKSSLADDWLQLKNPNGSVPGGIDPNGVGYGSLTQGGSTFSSPVAQVVQSGLMAEYRILSTESAAELIDYSGNGNNAVGTVGVAPTIIANSGGLNFVGNGAVILPAALNSALTIQVFVGYQPTSNANLVNGLVVGNNASAYIGLLLYAPSGSVVSPYPEIITESTAPPSGVHGSSLGTFRGNGPMSLVLSTQDLFYVGNSYNITAVAAERGPSAGAQTLGNYQLGGYVNYLTGQIYYALFYNRVLTQEEIAQNHEYMMSAMLARGVVTSTASTNNVDQIIFQGDSITNGAGVAVPPWPADLTLSGVWNKNTLAQTGWGLLPISTIPGINQLAPYYDDECFQILASRNLLTIWAGTNDLAQGGYTVAQTVAALGSYIRARKSEGWRVLVATMISRVGNGTGGTSNDTLKNEYNAYIRSLWRQWGADGLVDVAANALLGADGAYADTTYFAVDGTHPTTLSASTIIAPMFQQAINRFYGNVDFSTATTYTSTTMQADADKCVILGGSSSSQTFTLETCIGYTGQRIYIKNTNTNAWAVAANSGETIDGASSLSLGSGKTLVLESILVSAPAAGANWMVIQNG